jgi:hypothetical protein
MNPERKRLLRLFSGLEAGDRATLLAFAEFLSARAPSAQPESLRVRPIPRPETETVVAAIKRLSASYPMLDKATLLNETSLLMSQHVTQGRDAVEVIEDLEVLFRRHYERHTPGGDASS